MFSWILAFSLALLVWIAATTYLWVVRRPKRETRLGLDALVGMHWRDFSEIVKRALHDRRRLVEVGADEEGIHEPRSDFMLTDGEHRILVSCKHGRAYRIGKAAVNELGATARLAGARGGILITEGLIEREGLAAAEKQSVEVLDGRVLWPLLRPYVPGDIESRVVGRARRQAIRHSAIAAMAAVTLGLLVGMSYLSSSANRPAAGDPAAPVVPAPASVASGAANAPAPADAPPRTDTAPAVAGAATTAVNPGDGDPDDETLLRYQGELSRALAGKPGIASGVWITRQTLAINRTGETQDVWPLICKEVMRYPALRTVRIQINARPGVDEPVRWRQCTTI